MWRGAYFLPNELREDGVVCGFIEAGENPVRHINPAFTLKEPRQDFHLPSDLDGVAL